MHLEKTGSAVERGDTTWAGLHPLAAGVMEAGHDGDIADLSGGLEALFRAHYARMVRSLAVACGDREDAADAVQEAFIQLCLHWNRVSRYDDPAAWVRRVAVNRLSNRRRSRRRRAAVLLRLQTQERAPASDRSSAGSSNGELADALGRLPTRQRVAVALYYLEDLSVAEVARSMGISEGSVTTHLHRARAALKPMLEA